jgi:hypothetical protein
MCTDLYWKRLLVISIAAIDVLVRESGTIVKGMSTIDRFKFTCHYPTSARGSDTSILCLGSTYNNHPHGIHCPYKFHARDIQINIIDINRMYLEVLVICEQ